MQINTSGGNRRLPLKQANDPETLTRLRPEIGKGGRYS